MSIKESTLKTYYSSLRGLGKKVGVKNIDLEKNWIDNKWENIIDEITNNTHSIHSQKNLWIILCSIGEFWGMKEKQLEFARQKVEELNKQIKDLAKDHELTNKEKQNWISLAELDKKIDDLKKKLPSSKNLIDTYSEYKQLCIYLSY